ncbi:hypothetical protein NDU88_009147 [Pleurodeles waltl]|uniref:Uncharacterized protein n=1 Tax=Pleurodeles waltl TaxID=8319 RepID=A0AAV7PRX7_PLEWA|nr:hypothetical protein NDU88_009147 [Pleurodeles waltl]
MRVRGLATRQNGRLGVELCRTVGLVSGTVALRGRRVPCLNHQRGTEGCYHRGRRRPGARRARSPPRPWVIQQPDLQQREGLEQLRTP